MYKQKLRLKEIKNALCSKSKTLTFHRAKQFSKSFRRKHAAQPPAVFEEWLNR